MSTLRQCSLSIEYDLLWILNSLYFLWHDTVRCLNYITVIGVYTKQDYFCPLLFVCYVSFTDVVYIFEGYILSSYMTVPDIFTYSTDISVYINILIEPRTRRANGHLESIYGKHCIVYISHRSVFYEHLSLRSSSLLPDLVFPWRYSTLHFSSNTHNRMYCLFDCFRPVYYRSQQYLIEYR